MSSSPAGVRFARSRSNRVVHRPARSCMRSIETDDARRPESRAGRTRTCNQRIMRLRSHTRNDDSGDDMLSLPSREKSASAALTQIRPPLSQFSSLHLRLGTAQAGDARPYRSPFEPEVAQAAATIHVDSAVRPPAPTSPGSVFDAAEQAQHSVEYG
jgi:hypothetical protein